MKKFWKRYGFVILAISPFFIQFLVFQLVPTISTILLSFTDWNGMSKPRFIGLNNYKMMLVDYQFREALRNTLIYWVVSVIFVISLSLIIAVLLNYKGLRCRRFFKTAMFLPYVCATAVQQFFRITLPQLSNITFFCIVTITVDAFRLFNESYTLSGPGTSNTSLFQLMYENAFSLFKMGYGSAIGVVLVVILLIISFIQFKVRRSQGEL